MQFQTTRLTIREVSLVDLIAIHELLSLPETDQFNTLGIPENMEATAQLVLGWSGEKDKVRNAYTFSIELTSTRQFIGLIALYKGKPTYKKGEIWFKTHSKHWNMGYTTEALKRILKFAFTELKLHRVEAGCAVPNTASKRVLEKVGMVQEGLLRANLPIRGQWIDNFEFGMLDSDYEKLVESGDEEEATTKIP